MSPQSTHISLLFIYFYKMNETKKFAIEKKPLSTKKFLYCFSNLHTRNIYGNSDICKLCTVHFGEEFKKPSAPTELKGKGLKF